MSTSTPKAWTAANREVVDIGGSQLGNTFDTQLPRAFKGEEYFPKELAYTVGMDKWCRIADTSYQTTDEMAIIEATAAGIVADMPADGSVIVDLGAANSKKFEPYVHAFIQQGKSCTYIALDLNKQSLTDHVAKAADKFPSVKCIGLWGNFQQGDKFFAHITGHRIFLSLGSIFFNAPDSMCVDRCAEFRKHLAFSPFDRLIVGQDGPSVIESSKTHKAYNTAAYDDFFTTYLGGIQAHAGIVADVKSAWTYQSKLDNGMHFFEVVAQHEMVCTLYDDFVVKAGTAYTMFPSWKRGEMEIHDITTDQGMKIKTLGKAASSGMRQYLVQPEQ
ncbi:hypothetical protein F66182_5046 [Fusarium sp. NRRL 66182]|nr:hypothetical protein F66182_5046 [Fusarium sp. NRRL 66182]